MPLNDFGYINELDAVHDIVRQDEHYKQYLLIGKQKKRWCECNVVSKH